MHQSRYHLLALPLQDTVQILLKVRVIRSDLVNFKALPALC